MLFISFHINIKITIFFTLLLIIKIHTFQSLIKKQLNEIVIENFDSLKSRIMNATKLFNNEKKNVFFISPVKKASNFLSRTQCFSFSAHDKAFIKEIQSLLHNDNTSRSRYIHKHTQKYFNLNH